MSEVRNYMLIIFMIFFEVFGKGYVGDKCILRSSGKPGTCQLYKNCPPAMQALRKNKRFPQPCGGYEAIQPIICCPLSRKPGEISLKKCEEYSAYVNQTIIIPTLLFKVDKMEKNECGRKVVKRIVGGVAAENKEFPHMAAIGYGSMNGEVKWLCGGTIISELYVLTAAHCLSNNSQGDAKWVKLGVTNLNDKEFQQINVIQRIAHHQYVPTSVYHDIGLLKLEKEIELNPCTVPACLYSRPDFSVTTAIATGWGHTSSEGTGSSQLMKVTIDLFNHSECNDFYKIMNRLRTGIKDEIHFCAGSKTEDNKDTCKGDSGGPLQIYHTDDDIYCMYDIIGITSFGKKSCLDAPSVYVRVSNYIKWIEDIVWP